MPLELMGCDTICFPHASPTMPLVAVPQLLSRTSFAPPIAPSSLAAMASNLAECEGAALEILSSSFGTMSTWATNNSAYMNGKARR